jgi:sugar lactone lactonase YvrE
VVRLSSAGPVPGRAPIRSRAILALLIATATATAAAQALPESRPAGQLEVVARLDGPLPTGVAVSADGRVFTCFPRWGDEVAFTVAEVKSGGVVPYPTEAINRSDPARAAETLLAVQSVVVDATGRRLWLVDTGDGFGPLRSGGPKLVAVDLASDTVVRTILLPLDVVPPGSYLNDVRLDLRRGSAGTAYLTDSRGTGLVVVDLATGRSWRRLKDHVSMLPEPAFTAVVEGAVLRRQGQRFQVGSDGLALSPDGQWLYYSVLTGRHLFRLRADVLADPARTEADVAATIENLGEKGGASDGLESDAEGRVYLTDVEHNAIRRWNPDGTIETLAYDPRLLWPDSLALAADGYLYVTANQIHRQASFQGRDLRQKPYAIFRLKVDATRIR